MPEVMVAVAGAAANFGGLVVQNRDHRVVHHAFALDAKIVDIVAESGRPHRNPLCHAWAD